MCSTATKQDGLTQLRNYLDETVANGQRRLPSEPKLSDALGIPRGKLRTLLKKLEQEGAIWRHVGKGTFIGPRELEEKPNIESTFSVDDILQARTILEPQLAALAAIHGSGEDIKQMELCLLEMQTVSSLIQWKRIDEKLHRIIAKASGNSLLLNLYDTLRLHMKYSLDSRIDRIFGTEKGPKEDTDDEHNAIVEAIRNHDPSEAELKMRQHLIFLRKKLFGLL